MVRSCLEGLSIFATLGLHLGFSAKLRIWQVSACKMEPRSGIISWFGPPTHLICSTHQECMCGVPPPNNSQTSCQFSCQSSSNCVFPSVALPAELVCQVVLSKGWVSTISENSQAGQYSIYAVQCLFWNLLHEFQDCLEVYPIYRNKISINKINSWPAKNP